MFLALSSLILASSVPGFWASEQILFQEVQRRLTSGMVGFKHVHQGCKHFGVIYLSVGRLSLSATHQEVQPLDRL